MTSDLIARARAGDDEAFRTLTEPHRRELTAHCYRMLGSLPDAEDALQDTLLAAWRGLPAFNERSSMRTWLYRIATNTCLNAIRTTRRRPTKAWDIPGVVPPEASRLGEVSWLGPFPDAAYDAPALAGPEVRYEQAESISLAFVAALQTLPPRQLAVLVLRDVMGFRSGEVAEMLSTTVGSVTSALNRARVAVRQRLPLSEDAAPVPGSLAERLITDRFVQAYEAADVPALVALFTDDMFVSMPPLPLEYHGRDAAARFFDRLLTSGRRYRLVLTRANGSPACGSYVAGPDGVWRGTGLFVVQPAGDGIAALTRFEADVLPWFDLPASLPPS